MKTCYLSGNNPKISKSLRILVNGVVFLALLILPGCSKKDKQPFPKSGRKNFPALEFKDSTIIEMYEGSLKTWVLKSTYMKRNMEADLLYAKPVNLVIYDSLGEETAWLDADSGAADDDVTILQVWGNVYARSRDGSSVKTDSLVWKKRTREISTDGFVKVVSEEGDTLTGDGFISDDKLENWQILNNVRTVIPNLEERMDDDSLDYREYDDSVYGLDSTVNKFDKNNNGIRGKMKNDMITGHVINSDSVNPKDE